jgi:hypothetical protein
MQPPPQPPVRFDVFKDMPDAVLQNVINYVDIGNVVSLSQVNQDLRKRLSSDETTLSSSLVKTRLPSITVTTQPTIFVCGEMENGRLALDSYWGRLLCQKCKTDPKFDLIPSTMAKKSYFLNDLDLLGMKFVSKPNPLNATWATAQYYSRVDCVRVGFAKQVQRGIT